MHCVCRCCISSIVKRFLYQISGMLMPQGDSITFNNSDSSDAMYVIKISEVCEVDFETLSGSVRDPK